MISACHYSVQQNADDPGGRPRAAREFKSRRPHQNPYFELMSVESLQGGSDHAAIDRNHGTVDVTGLVAS